MTRPDRHLCIATGQNLANLIPSLQLSAKEVLILETPQMTEAASNLKRALEAHQILVKRIPFDDKDPDSIRRSAESIAMELGEQPLVFNATGGHKLMTLELAEQLRLADDLHLLYAETRHDRLDWLKPKPAIEPMQDILMIDDVLRAQGYRRMTDGRRNETWLELAQKRGSLTRMLGDKAEKFGNFFGTLNYLADRALNEDGKAFKAIQYLNYPPGGRIAEMLEIAEKFDLLNWDRDTEITFLDEAAASYFRGGWLEEFVWFKLKGNTPRDWSVNLTVRSHKTDVENEFDAIVTHRNRTLIIECKTSGFGKNHNRDSAIIYKLAQLSDQIGGIMSQKLLLSARSVDEEVCQRAKNYGVDILAAGDVKQFVDYLRKWMRG